MKLVINSNKQITTFPSTITNTTTLGKTLEYQSDTLTITNLSGKAGLETINIVRVNRPYKNQKH